jgi:tetratricopeptide (TPR) repeat protein
VWQQYLYPLGVIALLATAFAVRRKVGRGPVTALLFFVGTLVPVLGFVDYFYMMFAFVADRFLYLPSIGIIALVVAGSAHGLERLGQRTPRAVLPLAFIILVVLGAGVWRRSVAYKSAETLYRDVLSKYPDSWLGHHSLGCVLGASNRPEEAITHLETALTLKPNYPTIRGYLGVVYSQVGRYDDALRAYTEALGQNPNDHVIRTNLGFTYVHLGEYNKAIDEYTTALRINPQYTPALKNLTRIVLFLIDSLCNEGEIQKAEEFADASRALAVRLGAQDLVREIDRLMRQYEAP